MKAKTIDKILRKKMTKYLESITDKDLRAAVKKDLIVTGGAIASMLLKETVNDYDVYLSNPKTTKLLAEHYVREFGGINSSFGGVVLTGDQVYEEGSELHNAADRLDPGQVSIFIPSAGVAGKLPDELEEGEAPEISEEEKTLGSFRPIFISANAVTLSDKVQIVIRFSGDADEIHSNFDFVHAMNYWTFDDGLCTNKESLLSLMTKELVYKGSKYPLASIIRTRKFISRGWTVNAGQYLKMAMQLNETDLTDINVLKDQLVGVDSAYFTWLLSELQSHLGKQESADKLDVCYVVQVIERIFG